MKKLSLIRIVQVGLIIAIMFSLNVTTVVKAASETYFFVTKWGTYGPSVFNPECVAVDSSGNIYVTDTVNDNIQKFTSDGVFVTKWGSHGSGDGKFSNPLAIAVDNLGNVYVTEGYDNHRVQKFTSNGDFIKKWGSSESADGQFYSPSGIAIDSSGNVYVADTGNGRVQKFTSNGDYLTQWETYGSVFEFIDGSASWEESCPVGVAVDNSGYVYVIDEFNASVQKFTSNGTYLTKCGTYGSDDGQFRNPEGVAVDSSGYVYVTDRGNDRIQKFASEPIETHDIIYDQTIYI